WSRCAPTSARRWRGWSTASPSWTRSSSATRPRPRPSARWSWPWPRTPGCWSSSWRTAAQHAYPDLPAPAQAGAEGQGGAGDPGPAGAPAGDEHPEVGVGGPRLRHAVPEAVPGDQPPDHRAPAAARDAAAPGHREGEGGPEGCQDQGGG